MVDFGKLLKKDKDEALYRKATETWGAVAQVDMAIEEMAELIQALCKTKRDGITPTAETRVKVAEEMADVEIMLEQLTLIFRNGADVDTFRRRKLARLEERLSNGKRNG